MSDYLQHGRRHHPDTGSDPILGLRNSPLEVMVAYGGVSGSGTSATYIDLTAWATSSEDVFTTQTGTGGLSSIHGIAIHEEGIYRIWTVWRVDSATVGDTLEGDLDLRSAFLSFWSFGNTQGDPNSQVVYTATPKLDLIQTASLIYIGGAAGPDPVVLPGLVFVTILNHAGNSFNVEAAIQIERLATSYTSNAVSHTPV